MFDLTTALKLSSLVCGFFGISTLLSRGATGSGILRCLPLALDFWLAAGLLKLSATADWSSILTAALILFVRKISTLNLSALRHTLSVTAKGINKSASR